MDAFVFFRAQNDGPHQWRELCLHGEVETDGINAYFLAMKYAGVEQIFNGRRRVAEVVFSDLNNEHGGCLKDDGFWHRAAGYRGGRFRSMMIGDLIIYSDCDVWVCAMNGWVRREDLKEWARHKIHEVQADQKRRDLEVIAAAKAKIQLKLRTGGGSE